MSQTWPNLSQDDIDTITAFFNYVDSDKDGYVTKTEIEDAMAVDLNQDGTITPDEKVAAGQEWFNSNFDLQDVNKDSQITLEELLDYNNLQKSS